MEGDDKYSVLCQLLDERCSGSTFSDDDMKKGSTERIVWRSSPNGRHSSVNSERVIQMASNFGTSFPLSGSFDLQASVKAEASL